jgi:hypothetical protein
MNSTELEAKKYGYSPTPVHVKAGTKVLAVTNEHNSLEITKVRPPSDQDPLAINSRFLEKLPRQPREVLIFLELEAGLIRKSRK